MKNYAMDALLDNTNAVHDKDLREKAELAKVCLPEIYEAFEKLPDDNVKALIATMLFFDSVLNVKYVKNKIKSKFDVYQAIESFFSGPLKEFMTVAVRAHMDKAPDTPDETRSFMRSLVGELETKN